MDFIKGNNEIVLNLKIQLVCGVNGKWDVKLAGICED